MELRLFLMASLISLCWSQGIQQFDRQPQYTEANAGDTVIMECRVFNKKGQCVWQKDGKPVGVYSGKYEWLSSPEQGDCSLRIYAAKAEFDTGEWECQVTASSFDAQDALTSDPAWLVIRVPPSVPHIESNSTQFESNSTLTANSGTPNTLRCVSRGGNPAPVLKWFLGDDELEADDQVNTTEKSGKIQTWTAVSTLKYTFDKSHNRDNLRCVSHHDAFPGKASETSVRLNILYAPTISLVKNQDTDLEENVDSASFQCLVDANPPASVIWRKLGPTSSNNVQGFQETLEFQPVSRKDSGTYSCEARNPLGVSNILTVTLDVKYSPTVVSVGPFSGNQLTASLYESAKLECRAEGNPVPRFKWLHRRTVNDEETVSVTSEDRVLIINNITYEHQGEYICAATNTINNKERTLASDPVTVRVVGPPQILREASSRFVASERGDDALLRAVFCADPKPIRVSWRWAGFQLEAGSGSGRFVAEALHKVTPSVAAAAEETLLVNSSLPRSLPEEPNAVYTFTGKKDECYETKLRIQRAELNDARHYYVTVENEKGSDSFYVTLTVKEPISMATIIAVVIACLFLIIVVTLCLLYAYRSERCCFQRDGGSKSTDLESMKSDVDSVQSSQCSNSSTSGLNSSKNKTITSCGSLLYADLQLPKTSNNGSMKVKSSWSTQQQQQQQNSSFSSTIDTSFDTNCDRYLTRTDV